MTRIFLAVMLGICCGRMAWAQSNGSIPEGPASVARSQLVKIVPVLESLPKNGVVAVQIQQAGEAPQFFAFRGDRSEVPEPGDQSIFQIGSVTKLFTTLLLAQEIAAKSARLSDPVQPWLPEGLVLPRRGEREISFVELATHTSGLPRLPPDFRLALLTGIASGENPYAGLTADWMGRSLRLCGAGEKAEPEYLYSNLGVGMLGHALCQHAGMSYAELLKARVTGPLELNDTVQFLNESQRERYVPGRAGLLNQEVPAWDFGMLEGAGALYSTVSDLGRFLEMHRNSAASPFPEAIELTHVARRSLSPTAEICLGWHRVRIGGHDCWWHNGATLGHSSLVAFSLDPPLSLVVLTNEGPAVFSGKVLADQVGSPLLQHFLRGESDVPEDGSPLNR